jgi:hypothetical protein
MPNWSFLLSSHRSVLEIISGLESLSLLFSNLHNGVNLALDHNWIWCLYSRGVGVCIPGVIVLLFGRLGNCVIITYAFCKMEGLCIGLCMAYLMPIFKNIRLKNIFAFVFSKIS